MLGFVNRTLKTFYDTSALIYLYFLLVRTRLEYSSAVWSPSKQLLIEKIERVQRKFTRQLCYCRNIDYTCVDYFERCHIFNLQTLSSWRQISDLVYLFKLANNKLNCLDMGRKIRIYAPTRIMRRKPLFYVNAKIIARKDLFMARVLTNANKYNLIDIFNYCSVFTFKRLVRQNFVWSLWQCRCFLSTVIYFPLFSYSLFTYIKYLFVCESVHVVGFVL